jgi:hypothetical protein
MHLCAFVEGKFLFVWNKNIFFFPCEKMCGRCILVLVLFLGAAVTVSGNDADGSRV